MRPFTPLREKSSVSPSHVLSMANFLPIASAVLDTAVLAAFSDLPCLRRISIFDIWLELCVDADARRAFAMMPQNPLAGGRVRALLIFVLLLPGPLLSGPMY